MKACTLLGGHKCSVQETGCKLLMLSRSNGAPGEIRAPALLLWRQSLYPAELRARNGYHSSASRRNAIAYATTVNAGAAGISCRLPESISRAESCGSRR